MLEKPRVNVTQTFAGIIAGFEFAVSHISGAGELRRVGQVVLEVQLFLVFLVPCTSLPDRKSVV